MRTKEVMMVLLLVAIFYSGGTSSLGPLELTTLPLVHLEDKNVEPNGQVKHLSNNENGETDIVHHQRKLERAFGSQGVNGGQMAGNGGEGTKSPYTPGGAANIHHKNGHRSAGSCIQSCRNPPALAAILLAYLL
ncbi:hypothetical protein ACH5RR_019042 [Cinchona calisaya]|uniref:Uncharacterized protein n=1 Tax=Cinchona calisaya TaxID=153742 RepID=A0ABD2ZTE1_9GENT